MVEVDKDEDEEELIANALRLGQSQSQPHPIIESIQINIPELGRYSHCFPDADYFMIDKVRYNSQPFMGGDEDSQQDAREIREIVESQGVDVDDVRVMFGAMLGKDPVPLERAQSACKMDQDSRNLFNPKDDQEMHVENEVKVKDKDEGKNLD